MQSGKGPKAGERVDGTTPKPPPPPRKDAPPPDDPDDPDRRDYVRLAFAIVPNPRGSVRFYFSKPLFGPGDLPTRFPEPRRGALREDRNRSSSRAHSLGSEQLARTASRHAANKAAPIYIQRVTPRKARKHDWVRVTETSETSSSTSKRS